jgi:hypothetical protein
MRFESIAEIWASYRERVIPSDTPEVQVTECKRAFYAGVAGFISMLTEIESLSSASEEAVTSYLDSVDEELAAFLDSQMLAPTVQIEVRTPLVDEMNLLANFVEERLNGTVGERKWGFCLLVFPFGVAEGRTNYISNSSRENMVAALKEFLARSEGRLSGSKPTTVN